MKRLSICANAGAKKGREIAVDMPGGQLVIEYDGETVHLSGHAEFVCDCECDSI